MTPKRATSLINRTVKTFRLWPSFDQLEAFLRADGWTLTKEVWENDYRQRVWQKQKTEDALRPHEVRTPAEPIQKTTQWMSPALETIASMKGDRWALAEIAEIIAQIKVTP